MSPRVAPGTPHKRPGRRALGEAPAIPIPVRAPAEQIAAWTTAAMARGQTLSEWVRAELDRAAARRTRK